MLKAEDDIKIMVKPDAKPPKNNYVVLGNWTTDTVVFDFDNMSLREVRKIIRITIENCRMHDIRVGYKPVDS